MTHDEQVRVGDGSASANTIVAVKTNADGSGTAGENASALIVLLVVGLDCSLPTSVVAPVAKSIVNK